MIIIGAIVVVLVAAFLVVGSLNSRPLTKAQATAAITSSLQSAANQNHVPHALLYISAPNQGYTQSFAHYGKGSTPVDVNTPFHTASVGKVFTATLIGRLIDQNVLTLDDAISNFLSDDVLSGLFVVDGVDYSGDVTIRQLLNHTSGAADYFDGDVLSGEKMSVLVTLQPDVRYTPQDLLAFSRQNQQAVGTPGEVFNYSDTGYVLLGLIIEQVSGQSFATMLHQEIFDPLGMDDSYLLFYTQPKNGTKPMAEIVLNNHVVTHYTSVSVDWAGGGVVSTLDDLAVFTRALNNGKIIKPQTLNALYDFNNQFMRGIAYGNGFMAYRFSEYSNQLSFLPQMVGHMGILGTQLMYDAESDTVLIASFGSTKYAAGSVRTAIKVLSAVSRITTP